MLYHCSICDISLCIICTKSPPPLIIENAKTHKHPLTFVTRLVSCTCNVCGVPDAILPYMCLQCGFAVHPRCIDFPQVININRHDHRISFTHHIGHGYLKCGVCRKPLCQYNGAYSCLVCPNYAVHSRCATRYGVWDGAELKGKPEIVEDIAPFEVVGDDLIRHFSHDKHTLRLHTKHIIHDDSTRCEACSHPVGFDPIYSCEECCFILHERCANLPVKKRLVYHSLPFLLQGPGNGVHKVLDCRLCGKYFTGFEYKSQEKTPQHIDLHCSFFSEPFVHGGHSHPLYFVFQYGESHRCDSCDRKIFGHMLSCDVCGCTLCLRCASLPVKIKHRNDEHPLTLCCGEKANGKYWCDICEGELDPSKWFYTCFDCGGTAHAECVLGDFSRLIPGSIIDFYGHKLEVVLNNHNTRPLCSMCRSRCKVSVILQLCTSSSVYYFCSRSCLIGHFRSYLLKV
ncbi:unnamed protein product [Arabis nemorensis]|uniref:Phorbol-ester/DAG-type domain-containing protein n=1 Tax=Arabis nemorensis TaxID=586526 RepID=A0A565CSG5_9BRAS|nr:unnamed protein product [Arabis nemorensis]